MKTATPNLHRLFFMYGNVVDLTDLFEKESLTRGLKKKGKIQMDS